ncbi:non-homologous end-joining DNA ligase [Streptomyces diastaticus]|uniref:non-homologous end-joining DNA ligase n=1 Tax=Streptomyces diastaticus TaxID=1956 RepID=UPI0033CE5244
MRYYASMAPVLLPQLRDRPLSFLRYPDGAEGETFFAKNVPPGTPDWVRVATVPRSARDTTSARQVVVDDLPSLMWAANLVTEFHTPQWRAEDPGEADRLVLDLDPGAPAGIAECCEVALLLRERLAADGLTAWVKTSGSKGLHLLVPLTGAPSRAVTAYAKELALAATREAPELVVHRMAKRLRAGKVFVDFSQNSASKTTATPYTLRARPHPTVSAPLTWEEVATRGEGPLPGLRIEASEALARVERHGDLLAPLSDGRAAAPLPGS